MKQLIMEQKYLEKCSGLLEQVTVEKYPDYKQQVGEVLSEYIPATEDILVTSKHPNLARDATDMITDLPAEDLREVMQDWVEFNKRIQEACEQIIGPGV